MSDAVAAEKDVTLLELLDRVLDKGVVASGDLVISVADVDLIYVGLRLLLSSVETMERLRGTAPTGALNEPALGLYADPLADRQDSRRSPAASHTPPRRPVETASPRALVEELEKIQERLPPRIDANPQDVENGLAKLVLTLIELIRQLLEKQAIRRMEGGSLSDDQIENLGTTLMRLENKMRELQAIFGLQDEDLNINLGPLGDLL